MIEFIKRLWNYRDKVTEQDMNRWEQGIHDVVEHAKNQGLHVQTIPARNADSPAFEYPLGASHSTYSAADGDLGYPTLGGTIETMNVGDYESGTGRVTQIYTHAASVGTTIQQWIRVGHRSSTRLGNWTNFLPIASAGTNIGTTAGEYRSGGMLIQCGATNIGSVPGNGNVNSPPILFNEPYNLPPNVVVVSRTPLGHSVAPLVGPTEITSESFVINMRRPGVTSPATVYLHWVAIGQTREVRT